MELHACPVSLGSINTSPVKDMTSGQCSAMELSLPSHINQLMVSSTFMILPELYKGLI